MLSHADSEEWDGDDARGVNSNVFHIPIKPCSIQQCKLIVDMRIKVPYSSRVEEFACHAASCAPPPAGSGGSLSGGRALTRFQQHTLDHISKTGSGGAPQSEARGLVARGLIERISGKGRGQGNTPQWQLTAKGKELTRGPEPTIAGKALPRAIRMGPPGTKEHTVHGETETHYKLGGYTVAKASLKPHMILASQRISAGTKVSVREGKPGDKVLFGKSGLDVSAMTHEYKYDHQAPPLKGVFTIKKIAPITSGVASGMSRKSGTAYHLEVEDHAGVTHYTRFPSQSKLTVLP